MASLRVTLAFPVMSVLLTLLVASVQANANVSQCSDTSGYRGYQWMGYYTTNFANEGVAGYIDVSNLKVANSNNQHALIYLSSASLSDPNAGAGSDWVQVGYGVGTVDAATTTSNDVYEEASDYNTSNGAGPVAHFYEYTTGNQYFFTDWTLETDSQGRGLYKGYYGTGSNTHFLGEAWHVSPSQVQFFAQFEGLTASTSNEDCPLLNWGLFGSTGDINNVQKTNATKLYIQNSSYNWVDWIPGNIDTSLHNQDPGNYVLTTYQLYDLFEVSGS